MFNFLKKKSEPVAAQPATLPKEECPVCKTVVTDGVMVICRGTDYNREKLWAGCWSCLAKPFTAIGQLEARLAALESDTAERVSALERTLYGNGGEVDEKEEFNGT